MSSLYDLVARNIMTGVVRVLMADMPEPAARDAIMAADPVREPDQEELIEKIGILHEIAMSSESKLSDQDRALWQAQPPVFRALVSFLGISDDRIADIVAIARKLEGG